MKRHIAPCANTKKATEAAARKAAREKEAAAKKAAKDRKEAEKTAKAQRKHIESLLEDALKGNQAAERFLRNHIKKDIPGLKEALARLDRNKRSQ